MKKALPIIVIVMLIALLAGCTNSNNSNDLEYIAPTKAEYIIETVQVTESSTEKPTEAEPKIIATYDFEPYGLMSENRAWVKYNKNSYAVIDDTGKILYSISANDKDLVYCHDYSSDGYAYYSIADKYVIIDREGKECYTTPTNTDEVQYSICGHGDNIFLLKKHVSSFSENAYYISQIDPTGNEVKPFREIGALLSTDFAYYGEGIFKSYKAWYTSNSEQGGFYNASTTNSYIEGNSAKFLSNFENGKALYRPNNQLTVYVSADVFASSDSYNQWIESLTENDAVPEETKPELNYSDNIQVKGYGSLSGSYYPLFLTGADGKTYYTIIDTDGNEQYDPIKVSFNVPTTMMYNKVDWDNVFFSEGYLAYLDGGTVYVIYLNGQTDSYDSNKIISIDGTYLLTNNKIINLKTKTVISQINEYDK